jgi:hypothetical protein
MKPSHSRALEKSKYHVWQSIWRQAGSKHIYKHCTECNHSYSFSRTKTDNTRMIEIIALKVSLAKCQTITLHHEEQ